MRFWFGFSKKIAPKTWLNFSRSGPSVTYGLGGGARVNWSPRRGLSFRFGRRLGKWCGDMASADSRSRQEPWLASI